jgi:hypothetical protein
MVLGGTQPGVRRCVGRPSVVSGGECAGSPTAAPHPGAMPALIHAPSPRPAVSHLGRVRLPGPPTAGHWCSSPQLLASRLEMGMLVMRCNDDRQAT